MYSSGSRHTQGTGCFMLGGTLCHTDFLQSNQELSSLPPSNWWLIDWTVFADFIAALTHGEKSNFRDRQQVMCIYLSLETTLCFVLMLSFTVESACRSSHSSHSATNQTPFKICSECSLESMCNLTPWDSGCLNKKDKCLAVTAAAVFRYQIRSESFR